jgi:hypothetical protein
MADNAALRDPDGSDAPVLYDLCMMDARLGLLRDVHRPTADDRTTACASAEFRQGHLNRHDIVSRVRGAPMGLPPAIQ